MRIAIHTGYSGVSQDLDGPGRGETRWGLHWGHILTKNGYDCSYGTGQALTKDFDLHLMCGLNAHECHESIKHIHMYCGVPSKETMSPFPCYRHGSAVIASMYYDYYDALRSMGEKAGYLGVPMSIPFSDDMISTISFDAATSNRRQTQIEQDHIGTTSGLSRYCLQIQLRGLD